MHVYVTLGIAEMVSTALMSTSVKTRVTRVMSTLLVTTKSEASRVLVNPVLPEMARCAGMLTNAFISTGIVVQTPTASTHWEVACANVTKVTLAMGDRAQRSMSASTQHLTLAMATLRVKTRLVPTVVNVWSGSMATDRTAMMSWNVPETTTAATEIPPVSIHVEAICVFVTPDSPGMDENVRILTNAKTRRVTRTLRARTLKEVFVVRVRTASVEMGPPAMTWTNAGRTPRSVIPMQHVTILRGRLYAAVMKGSRAMDECAQVRSWNSCQERGVIYSTR